MSAFQIDIAEAKPIATYVLRGQINLHSGKAVLDELSKGEDLIFERVHETHKSKVAFSKAERKEGFIYLYFIVLDNDHSYVYIIGETNERAIIRGGPFMEVEQEDAGDVSEIIQGYITGKAATYAKLYADKESPALITALNKAIGELADLM